MFRDLTYPIALEKGDEGDVVVTFPDLPEANSFGWSEAEALADAPDALRVALRVRMRDGEDIPNPSPIEPGSLSISAPAEVAAKLMVLDAFKRANISKVELAKRLGVLENEARRILDPDHRTKLDRLEQTARALGGRLQMEWHPL